MGERPVPGVVERCESGGEDGTDVVQRRSRVKVSAVKKKPRIGTRNAPSYGCLTYLRSLSGFGVLSSGSKLFRERHAFNANAWAMEVVKHNRRTH